MPLIGPSINNSFPVRCFQALVLFLIVSLLASTSLAGQRKLEIIPLKNRLVEEVIPTIRSVLGSRGTVSGMQGQLIIRAHPQALKEVKQVLRQLDSALRNLRITVKQGRKLRLHEQERSISGKLPIGKDGRVIIGSPESGELIFENGAGEEEIEVRLLDKLRKSNETDTQVVVTLEGRPALIHVTQSIPVSGTRIIRSGNTLTEVETTRFQDARTGLVVLPRLKGDQVILEISPQKSDLNGQRINTFGINTVVRGQIGEWMELGGLSQNRQSSGRGIGNRTATQNKGTRKVFIKVDYE